MWLCVFVNFDDFLILINKNNIKLDECIFHPHGNCSGRIKDKQHPCIFRHALDMHESSFSLALGISDVGINFAYLAVAFYANGLLIPSA
ncbi:uncharacterized protein METZ01_LOCUS255 [marine metagenome]|uniref:Uncharacterized protein n=1 Tax=marine metagenome TaxID=408172 RepID=A0A381MYK3_9ZZZZ